MMPRELESQLAALSKADKAMVVQRLALEIADAWPGIEVVEALPAAEPAACC